MPEGSFTLDEVLGNPTDLPIAEHTVDTGGQTLALFAAFCLVGLRFSPRIRDLPSRRLYRLGLAKELASYPHAGALLRQRINTDLILVWTIRDSRVLRSTEFAVIWPGSALRGCWVDR